MMLLSALGKHIHYFAVSGPLSPPDTNSLIFPYVFIRCACTTSRGDNKTNQRSACYQGMLVVQPRAQGKETFPHKARASWGPCLA
jgi:hypothetical protein